jgi:hypothetical protein
MIKVVFDYDQSRKKGIIISDYLPNIREYFSVEDKNNFFKRRFAVGYRPATRVYSVTPQGRFNVNLFEEIVGHLNTLESALDISVTDLFKSAFIKPALKKDAYKLPAKFLPRDYQQEAVETALEKGQGVFELATSAGKTFVAATLCKSIQRNLHKRDKILIIVPDTGLVRQTYGDFLDYGLTPADVTKWSGTEESISDAQIIIANIQILMSKKQDLTILKKVKLLIVDECIRRNTLICLKNGKIKPIQDIKIGDMVKSYNTTSKKIEYKKVLNTWKNLQKSNSCSYFIEIKLEDNSIIHLTPNHKVYTQRGYIRADKVRETDDVYIADSNFTSLWYRYQYAKTYIRAQLCNLFKKTKISRKTS